MPPVMFQRKRPGMRLDRQKRGPAWIHVGLRGFYAGFRLGDGAFHFGVRTFKDRSRHYGNQRHPERGVAFWCRRSRRGDRGYPYTVTFKLTTALRADGPKPRWMEQRR